MELKIKWLYKYRSFSVFENNTHVFVLSSASPCSSTLAFPSSNSIIFPWLYAVLNEEYFKETDRGLL
jgi:disulfide oxidoreductase YuzD